MRRLRKGSIRFDQAEWKRLMASSLLPMTEEAVDVLLEQIVAGRLTECWVMKRPKRIRPGTYPSVILADGRQERLSRVLCVAFSGNSMTGWCACHTCDNPNCVNPNHLRIGSKGDNNRDMFAKGRERRLKGEEGPKAKSSNAEVASIRWLWWNTDLCNLDIGNLFGLCKDTIRAMVLRRTWTDLPLVDGEGGTPPKKDLHKARGQRINKAVLDEERVRAIKLALKAKSATKAELARQYGVSFGTIASIEYGLTWKHVDVTD